MRRTKWQLSLFFCIVTALFISIANAQQSTEKSSVKSIKTTTTTTKRHKHTHSRKFQHTTTINNCTLASIQRSKSLSATKTTSTRLPHTQTVYVCSKRKHHVTKHGKQHHKKKTTTTTTRRSTHHSKKKSLTKKSTSTKKKTTKKTTTKKTTTKKTTTKKTTTTTKKTTTKKSTKKTTTAKASSTEVEKFNLPTTTEKALPTQVYTNSDDSKDDDQFIGAALPTQQEPAPTPVAGAPASAAPAINNTPKDNNNQVNAQTVETTETSDAEPQSKVIGVSVGAVVGCIAAVGLAGMFIYKRRERTTHDQDVEDMNQTSEVNTRWRTQSFMAVVAGAVAKLPKRSNSTSSNNGDSGGGVLGSIRRAASNASRSLSVRSKGSSRSSVQSYGIAVSGPVPAIARIDGDQAQYYGEPSSPTTGTHHTHAY